MASGFFLDTPSDQVSASSSWLETFLGVLPFALFGPVNVLLAYPYPSSAWWSSEGFAGIRLIVVFSIMLLGLVLGWAKAWPRWAFPYLGLWMVAAGASLAGGINRLVFPVGPEWPADQQILIAITSFALVIATVFLGPPLALAPFTLPPGPRRLDPAFLWLVSRCSHHLRDDRIRRRSRLTLAVFLPSVLVFLSALAYLRLAGKTPQVAAMLLGVILPVAVRVAAAKPGYLGFGLVVMVVVMLPIFMELLPPPKAVASP